MKHKSDLLIYITNPYGGYHLPFTDLGTCTTNRDDLTGADLVVFTGGEDVSPSYYGEEPGPFTEWNPDRDAYEREIFEEALFHRIPMTGICRGSQFLNVMNGGKLIQHLEDHPFPTHQVVTEDGEVFVSNTLHHQASVHTPETGMVLLATSWPDHCVEAYLYPETRCLGVQYHPEMSSCPKDAVVWYQNKVRELLGLQSSSNLPKSAIH